MRLLGDIGNCDIGDCDGEVSAPKGEQEWAQRAHKQGATRICI